MDGERNIRAIRLARLYIRTDTYSWGEIEVRTYLGARTTFLSDEGDWQILGLGHRSAFLNAILPTFLSPYKYCTPMNFMHAMRRSHFFIRATNTVPLCTSHRYADGGVKNKPRARHLAIHEEEQL